MQLDLIRTLQTVRAPAVQFFFELITTIGSAQVTLVLLPIVFWWISPRQGYRLLVLVLLATYLNSVLKDLGPLWLSDAGPLYTTRPYRLYPDQVWTCRENPLFDQEGVLARLCREEESYAFPSGHAQGSFVLWSYLAVVVRRRWVTVLAALMIVLIGVSRLYLGQHWPTDVLGGWLFGALLLGAGLWLFNRWQHRPQQLNRVLFASMAVLVPLLLVIDPDPTFNRARSLGLIAGASLGYAIQLRRVPFVVRAHWPMQLAKLCIGLLGIAAIQLALGALLPMVALVAFVLAVLTGLWATLGVPWISGFFLRPVSEVRSIR